MGFLKRLFGRSGTDDDRVTARPSCHQTPEPSLREPQGLSDEDEGTSVNSAGDFSLPGRSYYSELQRMDQAVSARNYLEAAAAARASLALLRMWLRDPRGEGKRLDIRIPALQQGGTILAITGDLEGLRDMQSLVEEFDHLAERAGSGNLNEGAEWKIRARSA